MRWKWVKKGKGNVKGNIKWGVDITPLNNVIINFVTSRYFIKRLSERSVNIVLKAYKRNRNSPKSSCKPKFYYYDKITRKIYQKMDWKKNIKDTIEDTCITCSNKVRINFFTFKGIQCKECRKNKVPLDSKIWVEKLKSLKIFTLDYIENQKNQILSYSKKNQNSHFHFFKVINSSEKVKLRRRTKIVKTGELKALSEKRKLINKNRPLNMLKNKVIKKFLEKKNIF